MIPLVVPNLGLGGSESVTVSCWLVRPGDRIVEGDRLVELLIGEITFDVSSPANGRLADVIADVDQPVHPGTLLAQIDPADPDE
jgi:pyruvate/2-oxoglutarate dehydrogenase complex dihydrolipoamide acyltransferase (E2) component